ncbi:MAG TPA: hypothetical protein VIF62_39895, partial [Labilithrix sp.]
PRRAPLARVVRSFDLRRIGIGLVGAALFAALGTLLLPWIGTAIGALLGAVAGLIEGTGALKRDASARVRQHVASFERDVRLQLEGAAERFARDIAASVDEAVEQALARRDESIAVMLDLEGKALAREKAKLVDVARLRSALRDHERRFADVADLALRTLSMPPRSGTLPL